MNNCSLKLNRNIPIFFLPEKITPQDWNCTFFQVLAHCLRGSQVEDVGQGGVFELPIFWHKFEGVELYALAYLGDMPPDF